MVKVVIDADIIIDFFRGKDRIFVLLKQLSLRGKIELLLPSLVCFELYAGRETKDLKKLERIEKLLMGIKILPLDKEIAKKAGFLARDYLELKDVVDFSVAATALVSEAYLATRNKKHFQAIKGLKFFIPPN